MSIDISTAPAAGAKAVVSHKHGHGKGEQQEAGAFTNLLSGKAKHAAAAAKDGEAQAKPAAQGVSKWQTREHAQWRVFDAVKNGKQGEATEETAAKEEEVPVDAEGQVRQVAMLFGHPVKAATTAAGGDHAKEGAAVAKETGAEAAVADTTAQPGRKRPVAEAAQARAPERHAAAATNDTQRGPMEPVQAGGDGNVDAPKPAGSAAAAPEAARERGARVQEREPAAERAAPKVTVMSVQTAPAPAAPAGAPSLSPTSASFVQSLGSADGLPRYVSETGTQSGAQNAPKPVTTLKIQLHPVDLGTVTAKLSGDSEKLSIEVHVENHEAHHRLQSDGDAIVKALRGMGFDIDRITIQQAPQTGASPGGATNRENAFSAPDQRAGEGRGQSWRQDSGRGYDEGRNQGGGDRSEARGSSGVYI
jgi:chemotaxis protein MotD